MASRSRSARFVAVLGAILLAVSVTAAPVAAASPTVRVPKSAAEWATFTPAEKDATIRWIWAQEAQMIADGTWRWDEAASSSATTDALAASVTGGVECGIKLNRQPWATYAIGWSSTWTSSPVWWLQTGGTGAYTNKFYHNGSVFSSGWIAAGSGTYEYGQSSQDFAFPWDTVTWKIQSWGSAETSYNVYLFKNKYCGKTAVS